MSSLLVRGGRLVDPANQRDELVDVLIERDVISAVGRDLIAPQARILDAQGSIVAPGLVDMHVHLREPGREDEETIESGSAAAARGGFTAICAMPNTDPVCDNAAIATKVSAGGRQAGLCEVVAAGAITKGLKGRELAALGEMARSDPRVRLFTDDGFCVQDAGVMRRAMQYLSAFGAVVAGHCEDEGLARGGQMHEGYQSGLLGLQGIPAAAEEVIVSRDIALCRLTGCRYHVLHASTAGSIELVRSAKQQGLPVTCEVTVHHLTMTSQALDSFDTVYKVNPPLRTDADITALREGLSDGTVDAIATDHAPHAEEEKESEFENAPAGMLGLETALGVVMTELVHSEVISIARAVELMSVNPARILGLESQGGPLTPGRLANLVVFNPDTEWTVDSNLFESRSRNSPWQGKRLRGRVVHTVLAGRPVVIDAQVARAPVGTP